MRKENSTNSLNEKHLREACTTAHALSVIAGRWKATILHILLHGKQRYSQLREIMPNISERMLAQQLKELEKNGLIQRTVYPEVPPRVEYALTEEGLLLKDILESLSAWGARHQQQQAPVTLTANK